MPTGYTAELCDKEVSFDRFVMTCARAMGACVSMREDPFDKEIPNEFRPSDYHEKAIEKARGEIKRLNSLSVQEISKEAKAAFSAELASFQEQVRKAEATRSRLGSMLAQVRSWVPPTTDHGDFKSFMIQQLEETLRFDGRVYSEYPVEKDPVAWHEEKLRQARHDIEYYTEENRKEIERCRSRSRWIQELRRSLNGAKCGR